MAHWGNADYSQLKRLQRRMERLQEHDFEAFCLAAAKELAARLLAAAKRRTPVGTKPTFKGAKSMKVTGASGKSKSFLTREGAILGQYWSGYLGGTLRRGWTAKTEQEARGGSDKDPVAYAKSLPIAKKGNVYQVDIINPVHYASFVEYGHRQTPGRYVPQIGKRLKKGWVKGQFMLTISEQELEHQMPALLEKQLAELLKGCFDG